jgi:hypothetical protein
VVLILKVARLVVVKLLVVGLAVKLAVEAVKLVAVVVKLAVAVVKVLLNLLVVERLKQKKPMYRALV